MCLYKMYLRSYVLENKRQGINNESNSSFKGKTKHMFMPSHMEVKWNHNINIGNTRVSQMKTVNIFLNLIY
jgi:hypothetical protein